jgi:hypothetical protein
MKDPSHLIRKEVFDALSGNVTLNSVALSVYNVVPDSGAYPYIYIYSVSNDDIDNNKSKYISNITTRVEVVTAFDTNTGGQLDCNLAMNQISQLLVSKTSFFDLSSNNFNVYNAVNNGITYITEDTETQTLYRAILSFQNSVEQTS